MKNERGVHVWLVVCALLPAVGGCAAISETFNKVVYRDLPEIENPVKGKAMVVEVRTTFEPADRTGARVDKDNKVVHECDEPLPPTRATVTAEGSDVCVRYIGYTWNVSSQQDTFRDTKRSFQVIVDSDRAEYKRLEIAQPPTFRATCTQAPAFDGGDPGPTYQVYEYDLEGCFDDVQLTEQSKKLFVFNEAVELGAWSLR